MTRAMPSSAIWAVPPVRGRDPFVAATGVVKVAPEVTLATLMVAPPVQGGDDVGHRVAEQTVEGTHDGGEHRQGATGVEDAGADAVGEAS